VGVDGGRRRATAIHTLLQVVPTNCYRRPPYAIYQLQYRERTVVPSVLFRPFYITLLEYENLIAILGYTPGNTIPRVHHRVRMVCRCAFDRCLHGAAHTFLDATPMLQASLEHSLFSYSGHCSARIKDTCKPRSAVMDSPRFGRKRENVTVNCCTRSSADRESPGQRDEEQRLYDTLCAQYDKDGYKNCETALLLTSISRTRYRSLTGATCMRSAGSF
jgi:hypothetical protein